jgi:hypothetical protein
MSFSSILKGIDNIFEDIKKDIPEKEKKPPIIPPKSVLEPLVTEPPVPGSAPASSAPGSGAPALATVSSPIPGSGAPAPATVSGLASVTPATVSGLASVTPATVSGLASVTPALVSVAPPAAPAPASSAQAPAVGSIPSAPVTPAPVAAAAASSAASTQASAAVAPAPAASTQASSAAAPKVSVTPAPAPLAKSPSSPAPLAKSPSSSAPKVAAAPKVEVTPALAKAPASPGPASSALAAAQSSLAQPKSTPTVAPPKLEAKPIKTVTDSKLEEIFSQCQNNVYNKNKCIDIFMNNFLNCEKIEKTTQTNTTTETLNAYFTELFSYSKNVLNKIQQYEDYTQRFVTYTKHPDILYILEGLTKNNINIESTGLNIKIGPVVKKQNTLTKLKEYNDKIGIKIYSEPSEQPVMNRSPFETLIYSYIDQFIGKDKEYLKLKKFDIVNHIANIDTGILMFGGGGAGSGSINSRPIVAKSAGAKVADTKGADTKGTLESKPIVSVPPLPEDIKGGMFSFKDPKMELKYEKTLTEENPTTGIQQINQVSYIVPKEKPTTNYNIYITKRDLELIKKFTLQYPEVETGGDFFGGIIEKDTPLYKKGDCYIHAVIGPGVGCERGKYFWKQSLDYMNETGNILQSSGAVHIGDWHSHNNLTLYVPSEGDTRTIKNAMDRYTRDFFPCFITNIKPDNTVQINPYMYVKNTNGTVTLHNANIQHLDDTKINDFSGLLTKYKEPEPK